MQSGIFSRAIFTRYVTFLNCNKVINQKKATVLLVDVIDHIWKKSCLFSALVSGGGGDEGQKQQKIGLKYFSYFNH